MKLRIRDFLERRRDAITISDDLNYKRATIKINHKGIYVRDEVNGSQIRTKKQFIIRKGQFLLSKIDARNGAFGIVPDDLDQGIITGNFWTFDVDQSKVCIDYFKAFTESVPFKEICIVSSSGTTNRKYLDEKKFLDIIIEIPSVDRQKLIINKYDEVKEKVTGLSYAVIEQKNSLSDLRKSILMNAIQGKLTKKWREENPNVEPASILFERIKEEKQQLIAEKKVKKEKQLPAIEEENNPFNIPKSWCWCRAQDICPNISSGSTPPKSYFKNQGVPYLKVYNIRNQSVDFNFREQFVELDYHRNKLKRSILSPGDVIMNIVGPPLGKIAIIPDTFEEWNCNQAIAFFKPLDRDLNKWIYTFLCAGTFIKEIELIGTAGQDNISVTKSKMILIPLPPKKEQKAIVKKVDSLMALCDELEEQIINSETQIELLMKSCLKEALEI